MKIAENQKQLYILLVTTMSSFLTPFMGSAVNVALPPLPRIIHDCLDLSWVATSFIWLPPSPYSPGPAGGYLWTRRMFIYGALIFTDGVVVLYFASTQSFLIAARALLGIGGAMIFSTARPC
jgi:MFS family permease